MAPPILSARNLHPGVTTLNRMHAEHWSRRYSRLLTGADFIIAVCSALLAFVVRFGSPVEGGVFYPLVTLAFPMAWVLTTTLCRCYEPRFISEGVEEFRRLGNAAVRFTAVFALACFVLKLNFARGYAILALPLTIVGCFVVRGVSRLMLRRLRRQGRASHRVLVVGNSRSAAELITQLRRDRGHAFKVCGVVCDEPDVYEVAGVAVVATTSHILEAVESRRMDTIVIAPSAPLTQGELRRLSWELEDSPVDLIVSPNLTDVTGPRVHVRPVGGMPLVQVERPELAGLRRAAKSGFDRGTALLALLILAPFFLVMAIIIKATSSGPAFFKQERVGQEGRTFRMVKFRSMRTGAEAELAHLAALNELDAGPMFKMRDDPRVTKIGKKLRRTSLDELPQLWNVVKGEMSLVGPRPPLPKEVEQYGVDVHRRLLVRPGITGLWQVSGRSDLTWEESVRLDLHYVENWSIFWDLAILGRTVMAVFAARGAY